jgi:hypothetical protein
MIQINIDIKNTATPAINQMLKDVKPGGALGMVMGRALANTLKKHFRARNLVPNKLGGTRTNFWSAVAAAVQNPVVSTGEVSVAVSHPAIAQKYYGGKIEPTKKKALAIPVHRLAHGRMARDMQGLAFRPAGTAAKKAGTVGYLVEGELRKITRGPRKGKDAMRPKVGGAMMFVLRKFVDQARDPKTLPPDAEMLEDIAKAARIFLDRPNQA